MDIGLNYTFNLTVHYDSVPVTAHVVATFWWVPSCTSKSKINTKLGHDAKVFCTTSRVDPSIPQWENKKVMLYGEG